MESYSSHEVAVIGAGVIGLSVALRARQAGMSVVVIDRGDPGHGTSWRAAGMLAPVSEADPAEPELFDLISRSSSAWPEFALELQKLSGVDPGFRAQGTLLVARDRDGAEDIDRQADIRHRLGLEVDRLLPSAARALEPALAPTIRAAAWLATDHSVDPRAVIDALVGACRQAGVDFSRAEVEPREVQSEQVVVATGAWSGAPVRPVKGQALALRARASSASLLSRILRFDGGYLVPRGDGSYYLGATVEEQGFDDRPTALGHYELLRDCAEVLPGVLELDIEEIIVGFRPGTPDNSPIIGRDRRDDRLVWAAGHYRHGIVLAPATADLVVADLRGEAVDHPFGIGRFAGVMA